MKIKEITVSAGGRFNHPQECYRNLSCEVTFRAEVEEGEDPDAVLAELQDKARLEAEAERRRVLEHQTALWNLEEEARRAEEEAERARLDKQLREEWEKERRAAQRQRAELYQVYQEAKRRRTHLLVAGNGNPLLSTSPMKFGGAIEEKRQEEEEEPPGPLGVDPGLIVFGP